MMNLEQFKEKLFTEGEKAGFTDLELYYERNDTLTISIYEGDVDEYEPSSVQGAAIRGLFKGNTGYAYTEKMDEASIQFLLENARENAHLMESEPEAFFTDEASYEDDNFYTEALEGVTPEAMIQFLKEVEEKVFAYDPRVTKISAVTLQKQTTEKGLYHNHGQALNEKNNFLKVMVMLLVEENGEVKSGMNFKVLKDFGALDADDIAKEAVEEGLSYLGGKSYPNQNYPVILRNEAAAALLATFATSFSAQAVHDGQSRLKGKLGESMASKKLTLVDDPFLPDGLRSATFDSEGVPTRKHKIVENGKLRTYFHNQKTAKKDGVTSTGHANRASYKEAIEVSPTNFYIEPSDQSYDELYAGLEEGMIITDLAGLHSGANPISGDFSLAADGYYVKDGKIAGPTRQMTVAGNFFDVLEDVEAVGEDLEFMPMDYNGYVGSPSLKVKSLSIAVD